MNTAPTPKLEPGNRLRRYINVGVVLWSSFLAAGVASFLFFAAVDPMLLRDAGPALFENLNREAGYALGFFFFWATSALASVVSVFLLRTERASRSAETGAGK
jgi:hypothetical protein